MVFHVVNPMPSFTIPNRGLWNCVCDYPFWLVWCLVCPPVVANGVIYDIGFTKKNNIRKKHAMFVMIWGLHILPRVVWMILDDYTNWEAGSQPKSEAGTAPQTSHCTTRRVRETPAHGQKIVAEAVTTHSTDLRLLSEAFIFVEVPQKGLTCVAPYVMFYRL